MSSSLALVLPGNRREVVKTTPMTTLGAVLAEACARAPRPLGDPAQFLLLNGKATLDLAMTVRFSGLANGARLDVVRNPAAAASAPAPKPLPTAGEAAQQPASADTPPAGERSAPPAAQRPAPSAAGACEGTRDAAAADAGAAADAAVDADPAAAAAAAAPAAAAREAAAAASAAVAARVGRVVRLYSRQALLSAGAAPVEELPESFYEFTPEDLQAVAAAAKRKEEPVMMTKAMREAAVAKRAAAFSRTLVRVELPGDALVLEAAFAPLEPLQALRDLVAACLHADAAAAAYLFTAPPKKRMANWGESFYAAKLIPAARVHCALEGPHAKDWPADKPVLRPDVAALLDAVSPSAAPLADSGAQPAASAATVAPVAPGPAAPAAEPEPPREGVRPPGELRARLAEGGKPKWLKL